MEEWTKHGLAALRSNMWFDPVLEKDPWTIDSTAVHSRPPPSKSISEI